MNEWFQYIVDNESLITNKAKCLAGDTGRLLNESQNASLHLASLQLSLGSHIRKLFNICEDFANWSD